VRLWKQKSNFTFISNGEFSNQWRLVAIPCVIELLYVLTATEEKLSSGWKYKYKHVWTDTCE